MRAPRLQAAQAGVDRAVEDMARLVMHAPFDGLLETDTAELGSLLQPGALCATLIQLDPMKLVGFATELQVARLTEGARAGAGWQAGARWRAGQLHLPLGGPANPHLPRGGDGAQRDNSISDGQSADIMIEADGREGHLIPASAVTLNDAGELGVRLVDDDGRVSFAPAPCCATPMTASGWPVCPMRSRRSLSGRNLPATGAMVDVTWREEAAQ